MRLRGQRKNADFFSKWDTCLSSLLSPGNSLKSVYSLRSLLQGLVMACRFRRPSPGIQ